ncbi:lysine-rich nucleolar protein 1 isoform X2 [Pleurodeles waltl]|uniref:lysine-rich nucleolar protein 1 isoform X2 n=1 Tax=Pleurodeles waltl TaxID=8319 RepID=UPI0037096CE1
MAREESMITKKKTNSVTYEEPIQKKKKKKKKKHPEAAAEPASEAQSHTELENEGLIKYKRKHRLAEEIVTDPGEEHAEESPVKKKKKKKKLNLKDESITSARITAENEEMGNDNEGQECLVPKDENAKSESFKKKRKKKKDKHILHLTEQEDQEESQMESADKSSILKKKRGASATRENVVISTSLETTERDTEEDHKDITKKKKKKKLKNKEEIIKSDLTENRTEKEDCGPVEQNSTNISSKKKKKKRLDRTLDSEEGTLSKDTIEADKCTVKTSKKRPTPECTVPKEISTSKKKKRVQVKQERAEEEMEDDSEVEIVSVKKGNRDEMKIDQNVNVGQWQSAAFDNPEQKMKFLRLMGGFKKSSQPTALSPALTEKPNMALSRTGEETLKQNLLSEFEKAIDLRQNRGIGLGFQPTAKKIFCIDKNKSTSVKFDD